jgi:hypothetical protein
MLSRVHLCVAATTLFATACTTTRVTAVGAPRSARAADCELTLVSLNDASSEYEQIGVVQVEGASPGAQATDPEVKAELRPKACQLGGEAVVLLQSSERKNGLGMTVFQDLLFGVFARKQTSGPVKY